MDCLQCSSCSLANFFFRFQLALETITQTAHNNTNKPCVAAKLFVNSAKWMFAGRSKKNGYEISHLSSFSEVFLDVVSRETAGDSGVKEILKEKRFTELFFFF